MVTPQNIVPTLQIMNGPMAGRLYKLDREVDDRRPQSRLRRRVAAQVGIAQARGHRAQETGFEIKDLGSTRGTFVNGQRLTDPILLKDGDTLQIGELQLTFNSRVVRSQEGDDEQSTVYAAIDVLNQSDRHFPLVKPEAKFRALRLIGQELGGTLVLERGPGPDLQFAVRDLSQGRARLCVAERSRQRGTLARDHPVTDRPGR